MLNKNGERALAHIQLISDIQPIEGADKIEVATVLGWKVVIAKKDNFKVGDKVIYIEVDSKVPDNREVFSFLKDRKYKVKTVRLRGQYSQGLIMPISAFPEFNNKELEVNDDVTDILGITYYNAEDNKRKDKVKDPYARWNRIVARHPIVRKKFFVWLKKFAWGRELVYILFDAFHRQDNTKFPTHFAYIHKTDEERVENMPWVLEDKEPWIKTTKIDGTSATYILEKKPLGRYEYYVLSRNIRQFTPTQANYHSTTENVYWNMSYKYTIESKLKSYLIKNNLDYVCVQGEIAGPGIQGNPHKLPDVKLYVFNLIDSKKGRYGSLEASRICAGMGFDFVPIIDVNYILPDTMEEFKVSADGPCEVPNSKGLREGYVYRSLDGEKSFKNVSRQYLMKQGERD